MILRLRTLWFWTKTYAYLVRHTCRGRNWHWITVDLETEVLPDGTNRRRRIHAKRSFGSFDLWVTDSEGVD